MTRSKTCLAFLVLGGLAFLPVTASGGGGLRIDSPQLNLGEVKSGTTAVATFEFFNEGDRDITILRAKPS
jgi:hypothetical protein